jgi:DNA polymerase III epsilon subunit-like protein
MDEENERVEARILVVDVETTGLQAREHSLLEIAAVWLTGGGGAASVGEVFHRECRIWPGAAIDPEALRINGASYERCRDPKLPSEGEVVLEFLQWVGDEPVLLAGLNPSLDRAFIRSAYWRRTGRTLETFSFRNLDLHSLVVSYALARGEPVPSRGFQTDEIYAVLGLPAEPKPHIAINGARKEAEALRMLLGIPELMEPVPYEVVDPARTDTARLDWMEQMRADCEGRVLSRCFLPGDQTLRENIDAMMKVNA